MASKKLRFRARGSALVQDFERLEAGVKRFVGRKYVEVEPGVWGFQPTGKDEEVPLRAEYMKACREGDLWPADAATAARCGVPFDPNFGAAAAPSKPAEKPAAKAEKG